MTAGEVIRIRTTGGGGWGDPLERDPSAVVLDVLEGKVSSAAARREYGVVLDDDGYDVDATEALRTRFAAERETPRFFDRGPGYERLSGTAEAEVDSR